MTEPFAETRTAVIQDIMRLAREKYVYPEIGDQIAAHLQARLEEGTYEESTDASDLAFRLTTDLQSVSKDRHWSVIYNPHGAPEEVDPEDEPDPERMARYLEMARRANYGFERVERLEGNVGYIDLRQFMPSEYGGETAVAAMNFVAHCDALIFDIRQNHGGYPSMVQLLTSYLYDPAPRHINTFYYRPTGETQQFWTFPHVPGKRRPDIPVYVLTSNATGSGAEEFAYNLKQMGRATLVGETTAGAAHPVTKEVVQGVFDVNLPYGRPINPVTGANWEGTGVEPHIAVPAADALRTAHLHALERLTAACRDKDAQNDLAWIAEIVASDYAPVVLAESDLERCAGEYGHRQFTVAQGVLCYGRREFPGTYSLVPMGQARFRLDHDMKFAFVLDAAGRATAVQIAYRDGRPEVLVDRTG
jgi:hypothetical protein